MTLSPIRMVATVSLRIYQDRASTLCWACLFYAMNTSWSIQETIAIKNVTSKTNKTPNRQSTAPCGKFPTSARRSISAVACSSSVHRRARCVSVARRPSRDWRRAACPPGRRPRSDAPSDATRHYPCTSSQTRRRRSSLTSQRQKCYNFALYPGFMCVLLST